MIWKITTTDREEWLVEAYSIYDALLIVEQELKAGGDDPDDPDDEDTMKWRSGAVRAVKEGRIRCAEVYTNKPIYRAKEPTE